MACARNDAMSAAAGKLRRGCGAVGCRDNAVGIAIQRDGGHCDGRQRRQPALQLGISRIAVDETEAMAITVDHDVDIIGIVERRAVRSKVASSKCQFGDHCCHKILAISRRLALRPARPRSS